jgi:hypothetical protein
MNTLAANYALARKLAEFGLPVFPCREKDAKTATGKELKAKAPYTEKGFYDATKDPQKINEWWTKWPNAVVGLPTGSISGISVLDGDIDRFTGEALGERELSALGLLNSRAVKVKTPSGGIHLLFAHKDGAKTSSHQVAAHVDARGDGGYIIAPGSVMADGSAYHYEGRTLHDALLAGDLPAYPVGEVTAAIEDFKQSKNMATLPMPSIAKGFEFDTGRAVATVTETIEIARTLLSMAPNTLCREDWVKLALSLRVECGDALRDAFIEFSLRYKSGTPCDDRAAQAVWNSAGNPSAVSSIAPAMALLKAAVGRAAFKDVWRKVLSRRGNASTEYSFVLDAASDTDLQWPEPDMTVLRPDRPKAPEMTEAEFNQVFGAWSGWLKSAAEVKSAHVDYVALALLTTASAIVGNTRWAVPWEGWKEPPVLWGMLIGDPSAGKSPALDAVLDPVKEIDGELSREYQTERTDWDAKDEVARIVLSQWKGDAKTAISAGETPPEKPDEADVGKPPIRKRIRITDATTEKVAELLATTWRGLLLSRDELSGWLSSMDRYSGGGDRPFWLEAHGGRSYTVDRKASPEPVIVEHMSVSILGGTQPDKLDRLLVKTDDDGLLARFLTVFPDAVPLRRPAAVLDDDTPTAAFKRLRTLQPAVDEHGAKRPFFMHLDEDAREALQSFREQCRAWEADTDGLMKGHIGKLPGLAVRVSLVLALLDWAIDATEEPATSISASHLWRACHYVGEHLRGHAHRAYGAASMPQEVRAASRIGEIIKAEGLRQISTREIQRRGLVGLQSAREIGPAFAVLQGAGWIAAIQQYGPGRPAKSYAVNPHLEDET